MNRTFSTLFLALVLLQGCQKFQPTLPEVEVPLAWKETTALDRDFPIPDRFWELFDDPVLNRLEQQAIEANLDLQAAAYRIEEARALTTKEHAKRLPHVDLSASVNADEALIDPGYYGVSRHKFERVHQQQYNLLADFSYEADLWGKLKDQEKSARLKTEASCWEYEFVYQTLVADVALSYFTIRTQEAEIRLLKRAIDIRKEKVDLYQSRVQGGVDSELNLSRAKLELALAESELEEVQRFYAIQQSSLAILLGAAAPSFQLEAGQLPEKIPPIPAILPSEMLLRRADIKRAWSLLTANRFEVDAALKRYFPSFSLSSMVGLASPTLASLFDWQARYWQYLLSAVEPLFDGGDRKAHVKQAKARFYETFTDYRKSVNQAFKDVEDGLSTFQTVGRQYLAQTRAFEAAHDTAALTQDQFKAGLISYLLVADAEHRELEVERQTAALKGDQFLAWVRLIKALGIQVKNDSNN